MAADPDKKQVFRRYRQIGKYPPMVYTPAGMEVPAPPKRCEARRMKPCRHITQLTGETMQKCGRIAVVERDGKLLCRQCSADT